MSEFLDVPESQEDVDFLLGIPGVAEFESHKIFGWEKLSWDGGFGYVSDWGWTAEEHAKTTRYPCATRLRSPAGETWEYPCGWAAGVEFRRLLEWVDKNGWPEGWPHW